MIPLDPAATLAHERRNVVHSVLLLGAMGVVLMAVGATLFGPGGAWAVAAGGVVALLFAPRISPYVVMRLYQARPLHPHELAELHDLTAELAGRAGLSRSPSLWYVPSGVPNAFSVGNREHAALAVTDGLLRRLSSRELVGVMAHEVAHIRHNDVWVMSLADLISRLTSLLSHFGQLILLLSLPAIALGYAWLSPLAVGMLLLGPMAITLLQLALSRTREFGADVGAVQLTGDPLGLASALEKIARQERGWLETILMPGRRNPEASVFRTHPATEKRIQRLLELAGRAPALAPRVPDRIEVPPHLGLVEVRPRWHVLDIWY